MTLHTQIICVRLLCYGEVEKCCNVLKEYIYFVPFCPAFLSPVSVCVDVFQSLKCPNYILTIKRTSDVKQCSVLCMFYTKLKTQLCVLLCVMFSKAICEAFLFAICIQCFSSNGYYQMRTF